MTPQFIEALADLLNRRNLASLEFEQGSTFVRMIQGGYRTSMPVTETVEHVPTSESAVLVYKSADIGHFRLTHPQRGEPCVQPGAKVANGETLGYLQCGDLLREVRSDREGTIARVLAVEGELIGYGQPLYEWQ